MCIFCTVLVYVCVLVGVGTAEKRRYRGRKRGETRIEEKVTAVQLGQMGGPTFLGLHFWQRPSPASSEEVVGGWG